MLYLGLEATFFWRNQPMTTLIASLTAAALASLNAAALASPPASWQQLDQRVARACIAASALSPPKMIADKASFSYRVAV